MALGVAEAALEAFNDEPDDDEGGPVVLTVG